MKQATQRSYARSARYYEEAQRYMPGGVNSNFRLGMEPFPLFFERAEGCKLCDVDGNEYVDYALGMGPVILGHADPAVTEAVKASLAQGQLYGGQHGAELTLAREICELVPCAEMVRFSLSGSDAVQAALRVARAFTGRRKIVKFEGHYHGWFDNIFVSVRPEEDLMGPPARPNAVPGSPGQDGNAHAETCVLPWNDFELLSSIVEQEGEKIAAVIMEPILCNTSVILPCAGYPEKARQLCNRQGIILIFDEVITGFRVGLGGVQQYLGVKPDLAVFAKALGNGYPISCLAGRREIMQLFVSQRVMHGGTYNTNTVGCAAALATLQRLRQDGGRVYSRIRELGTQLMDGLRRLAAEMGCPLHVQGLPSVFHTTFTDQEEIYDYRSYRRCRLDLQSQFVARLLDHGVRITDRGTWFLSAAHTQQDIEHTLEAARAALLTCTPFSLPEQNTNRMFWKEQGA